MVATLRRVAATERDEPRFRLAVERLRDARIRSRLTLQSRITFSHELLSDADHLPLREADRFSNLPVGPPPFGMIFIAHQ